MTAVATGRIDDVTVRVLAPNPSPMTLDGTNTYLLGRAATGERIVVDPGPDLPEHRHAVERALSAGDAGPVAVVVTHHHADHAEAAGWAGRWGVPLYAFDPGRVPGAQPLGDGDVLTRAGITVEAVHTPGHASDHLCLRVADTGAVLAGDHVLGRGTSVVFWPDGDMAAYLASLERVRRLAPTRLDPGHGPSLDDPAGTIAGYIAHRREREQQIVAALRQGAGTPGEIVAVVYADVDAALHPAAERSVRAHLVGMAAAGHVDLTEPPTGGEPQVRLRRAGGDHG